MEWHVQRAPTQGAQTYRETTRGYVRHLRDEKELSATVAPLSRTALHTMLDTLHPSEVLSSPEAAPGQRSRRDEEIAHVHNVRCRGP